MPNSENSGSNSQNFIEKVDFLEKAADLNPNLLFVIDLPKQRIIYINKRVTELLGHDADFVYSRGPEIFKTAVHPDDYERRLDNLYKCRKQADDRDCEVEVRFKTNNGWQWFKITERVFERDESGTVTKTIGTAQNIHQQKLGEEKLREEHRRLKNAQAIGHIGSFERKLPGNVVIYSEEFCRILGLDPGQNEISLEEFMSHVHPEDRETYLAAIKHTHATGKPLDMITRVVRPDGSIRHVHRRVAILKDENGTPVRVYGTVQDITERIIAEKERKRKENLIRATEIIAGTGSYEVEPGTNSFYFSDGLFRIFGEEPGSFEPSPEWVDNRSHPDDIPVVRQTLEQAAQHRKGYKYTRRIYRSDGEIRIIESHGSVVTDAAGNVVKFIGLVQDITERKQAEEELHRSEQRTKDLLSVLQNAPDAYVVLSPDFHIEMASDAYLEATYTNRKDILGRYMFEVFPDNPAIPNPTGAKNLKSSLQYVLTSKKFHRMVIQHYDVRRPSGEFEEKYWSPINTPVINAEGELESIIHRVLDVTDLVKKQATVKGLTSQTEMLKTSLEEIQLQADQLKESRALLQSVFDASPNSIILYKAIYNQNGSLEDFEFLMVNAFTLQLLGVTYDLIGKRMCREFPHARETGVLSEFKRTAETGMPADFEVLYEGDGLNHWFHFRATKINDVLVVTTEDITERKRAEQELLHLKDQLAEQANDKYRNIINSMDEGYCLLEIIFNEAGECVDYRYLDTNPVFEEQSGMKDVLGKTINELVPDSEPFSKKVYGRVAQTGESERIESYAEALGRWFDVFAFRIDDPGERHVAVTFKDITTRKDAEERRSFFLRFNDVVSPLTDPGEILKVAMQILGEHLEVDRTFYAEVLKDSNTMQITPVYLGNVPLLPNQLRISDLDPETREKFRKGQSLVLKDLSEGDKKTKEKAGIKACIEVPLLANDELLAVVGVQQTGPRRWKPEEVGLVKEVCERTTAAMERARVEKALRESEQRFRNLVEASAVAVWETAPNGKVVQDSPSWRAFTGQTFEEWTGNGWLQAVHPEDREHAMTEWREAVISKGKLEAEFRLRAASGEYRWINVKAIPILDPEGRVTSWSGMNLDIDDRKKAEEAIIEAKEMAEAASRAKEDFVSTISHEIRTPLNAVIGITNLLQDQQPREDQKENLDALSFSAKNLLSLINDILDFSKLEAGKMQLSENEFNLPHLLSSLIQAHQVQAQSNETQLKLNLDKNIPERIATDQLKLSQILHNLVSNAVKFTQDGEVQIKVGLGDRKEDDLWLDFSVIDTGIGIAQDKVDHIFDKFAQAESSTVRHYGGTGLGLTITKLLLELMGSEINLESIDGEGSKFYFRLPVKIARTQLSPAAPQENPEEEKRDLSNIKLLLVEDVEINRKIIIQFLQNWWELEPDEAVNGVEAVEMAKATDYDLILMDVRMPKMDGYEATRQIRKLPGYRDIPILALTADKKQEVQQALQVTQFSDLLTKPFEPQDLKQRILQYLDVSGKGFSEAKPVPTVEEENFSQAAQETSAASSFEISRFRKIAGKQQKVLQKLIGNSLKAFEKYKEEFTAAAAEENPESLSDLVHKNTTSVHYIQANRLAEKIENYRNLLESATPEKEELAEAKLAVLREFDKIIEGLRTLEKH